MNAGRSFSQIFLVLGGVWSLTTFVGWIPFYQALKSEQGSSKELSFLFLQSGAIGLLGLLVLGTLFRWWFKTQCSKPLRETLKTLQEINQTENLSLRVPPFEKSAFHLLSAPLNQLIQNFQASQTALFESTNAHANQIETLHLQLKEVSQSSAQIENNLGANREINAQSSKKNMNGGEQGDSFAKALGDMRRTIEELNDCVKRIEEKAPQIEKKLDELRLLTHEAEGGKKPKFTKFKSTFSPDHFKVKRLNIPQEQPIHYLILEPHTDQFPFKLRDALDQSPRDYQCLGMMSESQKGLNACAIHKPDLVFVDVLMKNDQSISLENGLEVIHEISKILPSTVIVAFSTHFSPELINASFSLGARAFIPKVDLLNNPLSYVESVLNEDLVLSKKCALNFLTWLRLRSRLTEDQAQVFSRMLQGWSRQEIAIWKNSDSGGKAVDRMVYKAFDNLGISLEKGVDLDARLRQFFE